MVPKSTHYVHEITMLFLKYSSLFEEEGMNKLITASLILVVLVALQTKAFAAKYDCKFKDVKLESVTSIQISEESLIINKDMEIPLEKSRVKCGSFGKQVRLDGSALGYQVVLKSCSSDAALEGYIVDAVNTAGADLLCNTAQQ
jgi:hypothetical protein